MIQNSFQDIENTNMRDHQRLRIIYRNLYVEFEESEPLG